MVLTASLLGKTKRWRHFGPVKQIQYTNASQITKEAKFRKKQTDRDKEKHNFLFQLRMCVTERDAATHIVVHLSKLYMVGQNVPPASLKPQVGMAVVLEDRNKRPRMRGTLGQGAVARLTPLFLLLLKMCGQLPIPEVTPRLA